MKHLFFIFFFLLLSFSGWAKEINLRTSVQPQTEVNSKVETDYQNANQPIIIEKRIECLERNDGFIFSALGIFFTAISIIIVLIQWYSSMKAEDKVYKRLAKLANQDKEAFIAAIKQKSIEVELMSYPLIIVADEKCPEVCSLKKLLSKYEFNNVNVKEYGEVISDCNKNKITNMHVLIFHKNQINIDRINEILDFQINFGILGFGSREELKNKDFSKNHNCVNYANSFASVYNNLMSLLHYKRYLNKTEG